MVATDVGTCIHKTQQSQGYQAQEHLGSHSNRSIEISDAFEDFKTNRQNTSRS